MLCSEWTNSPHRFNTIKFRFIKIMKGNKPGAKKRPGIVLLTVTVKDDAKRFAPYGGTLASRMTELDTYGLMRSAPLEGTLFYFQRTISRKSYFHDDGKNHRLPFCFSYKNGARISVISFLFLTIDLFFVPSLCPDVWKSNFALR